MGFRPGRFATVAPSSEYSIPLLVLPLPVFLVALLPAVLLRPLEGAGGADFADLGGTAVVFSIARSLSLSNLSRWNLQTIYCLWLWKIF
ncbi:hypothetical protein BJ878DRAFT_490932 [Calycina marina]|uniref:Uncharacterized protein n=1 Tax=Calycina marina TaxID=1763456 RepID=A0A9P7Z9E7_9HELO|nr:hypothetical protein BJ878DRAFT_490932 [Calycina marina]